MSAYDDLINGHSPLSWWKLDETTGTTLVDQTAFKDLTLSGTYTLDVASGAPAGVGAGVDFADGYATTTVTTGDYTPTAMTVVAWVNLDATNIDFASIISRTNTSGSTSAMGWGLAFDADGGVFFKVKDTTSTSGTAAFLATWATPPTGTLTMIIGEWAANGPTRIYSNGDNLEDTSSDTNITEAIDNESNILLGGAPNDSNRRLDGKIYDVAVLPVVLTGAEKDALYAAGLLAVDSLGLAEETDSALAVSIAGGAQPVALTTGNLGVVSSFWAGEMTANSVRVSAVVTGSPSAVRLVASESATFEEGWRGPSEAPGSYDLVKVEVTTLAANKSYFLALEVDGTVDLDTVGEVTTPLAAAGVAQDFQFGAASCSDFHTRVVFNHIHENNPDMRFFVHMGDLHYDNHVTDDEDLFQASFDTTLAVANMKAWFEAMPIYYMYDDHDYADNNSDSTAVSRPAAMAAFRRRVPTPDLAAPGTTVNDAVYYTFKVGRLRFIVTDLRSQRSDQSAVAEGPDRTMMGVQQKAWFKSVLSDPANNGDFFCWVNCVPWIGTASSSGDFWNGYATERTELATYIRDVGASSRLFILSGDMHALVHDDGTNSDYATGGGAPLWVFHCAPLANVNSIKGGPYSATAIQEQSLYGVFDVTDTGGDTITIDFSGRYVSQSTDTESEVQTAQMQLELGQFVSVGLATETDTALAITGQATITLGLATETDAALAITGQKTVALGLATETDTVLAVAPSQPSVVLLGLATETDTALGVIASQPSVIDLTIETDTALAITPFLPTAVGLATETDTALAITGQKTVALGLATETDTALAATAKKWTVVSVGLSSETGTALAMTIYRERVVQLGLAVEADSALRLVFGIEPFQVLLYEQTTAGSGAAPRRLRPLVFTDRIDGKTYVIMHDGSGGANLQEFVPKSTDEVFPAFQEPTLMAGGVLARIFVENASLESEQYTFAVRNRPILFGQVARPRPNDPVYQLTLDEQDVGQES